MKSPLRSFPLILWISVYSTLLFTSCKKDDDSTPQPETGAISGVISPAGAIAQVVATNAANQATTVAPGANGIFTLGSLPAGYYVVKFTPANGFAPPPERTANVTAGTTVDLGVISPPRAGVITGKFRYRPEGVSQISATDALNHSLTTTLDANNTFSFENLVAGPYTVSFTPASPRYVPPAPRSVSVTPGVTVSAGDTLDMSFRQPSGSATFTLDGVARTISRVQRFDVYGPLELRFGDFAESLRFSIPIFTGAGTYPLIYSSSDNTAFYSAPSFGVASQSGTLVVTNYDASAGAFSATFNFTGFGHTITNGTCTVLF